MKDDNTLINQAKQGDEKAFTELYNKHYKLIRYIIFDLIKNDEVANDLASVTFTKAFKKLDTYVNPISFEAWLKTIAVNTVIDYVRATKEKQNEQSIDSDANCIQIESTEADPESNLIKLESADILRVALTRLRSKYRKLLELRYFQGLSYEELSTELGIPIGTVKSDLNKAKHRLRYFFQIISKSTEQ